MQLIWITYTLLAGFAATVLAINCYSCESTYDTHCGDDFELENYWKLDCARVAAPRYLLPDLDYKNATACMKKIFEVGGERRVMRSCFYGEVNDTSVGCRTDPALIAVKEIDCLVCDDENYCNAAHRAWPGKTAITWSPIWAPTLLAMLARLNL